MGSGLWVGWAEAGQGHQGPSKSSQPSLSLPGQHKHLLFIRQGAFGPYYPSLNLEGAFCACKTLEVPHLCFISMFSLCVPLHECPVPSLALPACAVLVTSRVAAALGDTGTGIAGLLQVTAPCESSHSTCSSPDLS